MYGPLMVYGHRDIETEVYRITPQNAVGLLECRATWIPTGTTVYATGRSSAEVTALACAALARAIKEEGSE